MPLLLPLLLLGRGLRRGGASPSCVPDPPPSPQVFVARFSAAFPGRVRVLERQAAHLRVSVSRTGASPPALSDVFAAVEALRAGDAATGAAACAVSAYQVSQTSLEQVFLDLAGKGGGGDGEGKGPWAEAREAFAARALALHLVVAPCALLVRWGLLLGLTFLAVCLTPIPPLGACSLRLLARCIQWRARADSRLLDSWARSPASRANRLPPTPVTVDGAALPRAACCRCRLAGCCGLTESGSAVFSDPVAASALVYLLLLQPLVVFACLGASALTLVFGVASLAGFLPSLIVQKRLAIWHRDLAARFLCEEGRSIGKPSIEPDVLAPLVAP